MVEREETKRTKIDAQSEVLDVLAENDALNMWQIKEQRRLFYSSVHKAVNTLEKEGLIQQIRSEKSAKGAKTNLYGLSFRGFINYLATRPNLQETIEPKGAETLNRNRKIREEGRIKLLCLIEAQGKRLDYALFSEIKWLQDHYNITVLYDILNIAEIIKDQQPGPAGSLRLLEYFKKEAASLKDEMELLLKEHEPNETVDLKSLQLTKQRFEAAKTNLDILLKSQNEWWKRAFTTRFAERYQPPLKGKGDMKNEALCSLFAKTAEDIIRLELEPTQKMVEIFDGGD